MLETVITLKPRSRGATLATWYSSWAPEFVKPVLRHFTPDTISPNELVQLMDQSLRVPGLSNAWTMPVKGRIEMLTTGMRIPVGLKISGADLSKIEQIGTQLETVLAKVKGTRGVFAERTGTGYFLDFEWDRNRLAPYGLSIEDAQQAVENAIGGEDVLPPSSDGSVILSTCATCAIFAAIWDHCSASWFRLAKSKSRSANWRRFTSPAARQ